jgi:hypothetical protein
MQPNTDVYMHSMFVTNMVTKKYYIVEIFGCIYGDNLSSILRMPFGGLMVTKIMPINKINESIYGHNICFYSVAIWAVFMVTKNK